jgi:HSP20 family molecular chaperone IbpA
MTTHIEPTAPAVDVFENADEVLLLADLPGVTAPNLTVKVDDGRLFVEAKRGANQVYARTFRVPEGTDVERVSAELTDGVVTLHLPKSAAKKTRQIPIKT